MQNGLSALLFGTSCCAKHLQDKAFQDLNLSECGIQTLNAPAKAADLLIITGSVNAKLAPYLINLYNKMPKPAYVMLLGDCACNEGIFSDTNVKKIDIESFLPVDIRLKGCPVDDFELINALKELKNKIKNTYIKDDKNTKNTDTDSVLEMSDTLKTPDNKELEVQKI